jgi:hypothetical protein
MRLLLCRALLTKHALQPATFQENRVAHFGETLSRAAKQSDAPFQFRLAQIPNHLAASFPANLRRCAAIRAKIIPASWRASAEAAKEREFSPLAAQLSRCATAQAPHGAEAEPGAGIHEMPFCAAKENAADGQRASN